MADVQIENMVASATIAKDLDLNMLAAFLPDGNYEQYPRFPGIVVRMRNPKSAVLVFRSGKVICTGAKNIEDVSKAIDKVCRKVKEVGFEVFEKPEITVHNIVATANLHAELNLKAVALAVGLEKVEYEPEQFPGLVYRHEEPRAVVLLFATGKLVCTGAKKAEQVSEAIDKITKELDDKGLL